MIMIIIMIIIIITNDDDDDDYDDDDLEYSIGHGKKHVGSHGSARDAVVNDVNVILIL